MSRLRILIILIGAASLIALAALGRPLSAQTDLDAFMKQVLARRDDNWKKLQQYILDEREQIELRGTGRVPIWGDRRDYTWYIRDGFFVRSPLKANGVTIGEAERRKFEADYLRRAQARDKRAGRGRVAVDLNSGGSVEATAATASPEAARAAQP